VTGSIYKKKIRLQIAQKTKQKGASKRVPKLKKKNQAGIGMWLIA